ncbi:MAG: phosphatase PAP2 family protein [Minisyncoccota bacterium]
MLRDFFYKLPANVARCFQGANFLWHLFAIALTYIFVTSGLDWLYFESTRAGWFLTLGFPAALLGFFVPILLPVGLYIFGKRRESTILKNIAAALGQAAIIGWLVSSFYKAFTGRLQPELAVNFPHVDISRNFNFGFLKHGIFWGWPSSHTTVAFAMVATLVALYPRHKKIIALAIIYALYIGLGVSVTIHWFSDFVAGAIIGTIIGLVVGESYRARLSLA